MQNDEYVQGLRAAAVIVEKFAKQNPNSVLICEDIAIEIRRRAKLAALRKPRTAKAKPETTA